MLEWRNEGVREHLRFGEYIAIVTPTKRLWHLVDVVRLGNTAAERCTVVKLKADAKAWAERELSQLAASPIVVKRRTKPKAWWRQGA